TRKRARRGKRIHENESLFEVATPWPRSTGCDPHVIDRDLPTASRDSEAKRPLPSGWNREWDVGRSVVSCHDPGTGEASYVVPLFCIQTPNCVSMVSSIRQENVSK